MQSINPLYRFFYIIEGIVLFIITVSIFLSSTRYWATEAFNLIYDSQFGEILIDLGDTLNLPFTNFADKYINFQSPFFDYFLSVLLYSTVVMIIHTLLRLIFRIGKHNDLT
ncbi:hypothetical protein H6762_03720 [Candidatus Nomurabacteria bacterium]|uniref:Uncharacterized protein n=1 Tax=Candidatus Dojkabacteria bacterium TaxID=2099670 RepID=A0A955I8L8_9BACT|nr:hypothetical protein [Candidatus Dojkabacteria bacterium]MCB9790069.1 hypothetical protein [Candidatus Nomurabacteria bacterium]